MKGNKTFEEWWNSLTEEQREYWKELVIARIETMPDNIKLAILSDNNSNKKK